MTQTELPQTGLLPGQSFRSITDTIARIPLDYPASLRWVILFGLSVVGVIVFLAAAVITFGVGIGTWGINIPVNWGIAISNTVWWIGIGHAGTFISAMLLLTQQDWRNSLNRFAEAMTLFAATCAVLYPLLHLGRPFFFYFVIPYPAEMGVWPQFRSPLEWDMFAFATYLTVSFLFWYVGLIPDLAAVRDRAQRRGWQVFFGLLALGWRGSASHWIRWRRCYRLIAVLALPLVVSVHSGVSLLFAVGPIPGWHTTIFPPYFVLGAVFSGFAVVILIAVTLRWAFHLEALVTLRHLDLLALFLLATGLMTGFGYLYDAFMAWYSGDPFDLQTGLDRWTGPFAGEYWAAVLLNFLPLQLFWFPALRRSIPVLLGVGTAVTLGMWFERYMLVISALYRDYLESSVHAYRASLTEWLVFGGLVGLFLFLFMLFVRFLPQISIFELKEVVAHERERPDAG